MRHVKCNGFIHFLSYKIRLETLNIRPVGLYFQEGFIEWIFWIKLTPFTKR